MILFARPAVSAQGVNEEEERSRSAVALPPKPVLPAAARLNMYIFILLFKVTTGSQEAAFRTNFEENWRNLCLV